MQSNKKQIFSLYFSLLFILQRVKTSDDLQVFALQHKLLD